LLFAGMILLLAAVLIHPLLLESGGQEHPPNCPVCIHFSAEFGMLEFFFVAHFLTLIGYFLAVPQAKLASRFFFVSSGRAPPALF
jgi:hypothetical protein